MNDIQTGPPRPVAAPALDVLGTPRPAPVWRRLVAMLIDLGPVAFICAPTVLVITWLELTLPVRGAYLALPLVPLSWLACGSYFVLMESSERGATWGKRVMRLRVTTAGGERVGMARAAWRLFLMLACLYVAPVSLLFALLGRRRRALHDLLSGCEVVIVEDVARRSWPELDARAPTGSTHPEGIAGRGGVRG